MEVKFDVKRRRISVTQGFADVCLNGEVLFSCGDNIKLLEPGEKYYGEFIAGYASTTPDIDILQGMIYHKYDHVYHYSDRIKHQMDKLREEEVNDAPVCQKLSTLADTLHWPNKIMVNDSIGILSGFVPVNKLRYRPIYSFPSGDKLVEDSDLIPYDGD